jgi:hypothetical protein
MLRSPKNKWLFAIAIWVFFSAILFFYTYSTQTNTLLGTTLSFVIWILLTMIWMAISRIILIPRRLSKGEYLRQLIGISLIVIFLVFATVISLGLIK